MNKDKVIVWILTSTNSTRFDEHAPSRSVHTDWKGSLVLLQHIKI